MIEPVAYINVEKRTLEWAGPTRWETPTIVKMDKVPLYTTPQKYCPSENNLAYERGFIDGQQKQIESAVHRMVTAMGTPTYHIPSKEKEWVGLTDEEYIEMWGGTGKPLLLNFFRKIEAKLKEKNNG